MYRRLLLVLPFVLACGEAPEVVDDEAGTAEVIEVADAEAEEAAAIKADAPGLTSTQAKKVLGLLDDVCGDTWCEGDFNWLFRKLTCRFDQRTCTLTVQAHYHGEEQDIVWRSCKMTAISGYSSMVNRSGALVERFYGKVNACISKIEDRLHETMP